MAPSLSPPPLPRGLADPRPVIIVGILGWLVAGMVSHFTAAPAGWVWTCVAGVLLGLLGYAVMSLQRSSARRGVKGAQQGLL